MTPPRPPSGHPPPSVAPLRGAKVAITPLAEEVARRFRAEFPDEAETYGEVGMEWAVHDNQHIIAWAAGAVEGYVDLEREVAWLGRVLGARGYPVERLARDLEIAADVCEERVPDHGAELGARLRAATASAGGTP